ncbi:MAG TPA: lysophospholipid acyltransferase family protein [Polyangiaceae bacterium]|jgi:1-acyl-sn-glycerol-3-phosphate acyltransferase
MLARAMRMRLFSVAYWAFIAICCVPFFALALVIYVVTLPFDRRRVVLHLFSCFWAAFYIYASPIWRLRVVGRNKLPWRGPAVIVANHASLIDILVLFSLYRPFKWVSKAENFKLPFIGWNMTLNDYVPLVRGKKSSIVAMMDHCKRHLARGMPVLIFPEGTRTRTGELQEFKDGAFRLAAEVGCPVVPVAVHGTRHSLPTHGAVLRNGMSAVVEVLDPIAPGVDADALREAARDAIAEALARRSGVVPVVAKRAA